jgi:MEMO1 family protein
MRRQVWWALASLAVAFTAYSQTVRKPAVAGTFYPADAKELSTSVDGYLAKATPPEIKDLVALVAPHAGHMFSGGVAGYSYALLKGRKIDRVVLISPSHIEAFPFSAVFDGTAYETPLGQVPVDREFAAQLAKGNELVKLSTRGHIATSGRGEHALEVQLPFLQRALGTFQLVPVIMGDQSYEACRALGMALAKLVRGPETLIVASSDLSHFHKYDEAVKLDRKTLRAIEEWDYLSMSRNFDLRVWEACGGGPIIAAMIAAQRLGAKQAKVLKYANSGDVTGDHSRVVGYGAVAFFKGQAADGSGAAAFSLSDAEEDELMALARKSVETAVKEQKLYECPASAREPLMQERGAFVTLKKNGQLRGCIGYSAPLKPLYFTVRDVAAMAAVRDIRFPPVGARELPELQYEISVLSPLRRVLDVNRIEVGKHGLVVKKGSKEGLLLPQVPVEQGWDRNTFLQQACVKAGLPVSAWQDDDTDVFEFTALVFGEHAGNGTVKVKPSAAGR